MFKRMKRFSLVLVLALVSVGALLWALDGADSLLKPDVVQAQASTLHVAPGGSDTPGCGGLTSPCQTVQYAVDLAATGDEIHVASGTYDTLNVRNGVTQVVYLDKSVTLRGGYNGDFSAWDPEANVTTLDAQGGGRVIYITGAVSPTVEGFVVTNGDATGQGGGFPTWMDAGGGIYVVTATATISGNVVTNNIASSASMADAQGGGIYLKQSDSHLVGNTITQNEAASAGWSSGEGGGLCAEGGAPWVQGNRITDNQASEGSGWFADGTGGGISFAASTPTLDANLIIGNRAVGTGDFGSGGGIAILGCTAFTLTNNVVADNSATYSGGGIDINALSGVPSRGHFYHTTIADNDGGAYQAAAVRVQGSSGSVVIFTNTILVGHEVGMYVSNGCTATLTATLWGNTVDVGDDVGDVFTGTLNYTGDPGFLNASVGDYHIAPTSAAVDRGLDAAVTIDMDGEARDANPDLGADEAGDLALLVAKSASYSVVFPGEMLDYAIAITNAGSVELTSVDLIDSLPDPVRLLGTSPGCIIDDDGYGGRVLCSLGDLSGGVARQITISAQVNPTPPPGLPLSMRNTVTVTADQTQNSAHADATLKPPQDCHARIDGQLPEYTRVQLAVDAAHAGDVIWIAGTCLGAYEGAGTFQHVYLDEDVTLRGGYANDFSTWDPTIYTTTLDAEGEGRVVLVAPGREVHLESLHLTDGSANGQGGGPYDFDDLGGGLAAISATVHLSDTFISGNVGSENFNGFGGGVGVMTSTLTAVDTTFANNTASQASLGQGEGGGLFAFASHVYLTSTSFVENAAAGPFFGMGGGAAVHESTLAAEAVIWENNTVGRDVGVGEGGGLLVSGGQPFTLTNCVFAGNEATDGSGSGGGGLWVTGGAGTLLHPTFARNRGGEGVGLTYSSTVTITNALVVSHSVGVAADASSAATIHGVLWHQNISNTVGAVTVTDAFTDTPGFAADGLHITKDAAARDNGIVSGVPFDLDGQRRPFGTGYDLGADEYACYAVTGLQIAGPAEVPLGVTRTFTAAVQPVTATLPITFTWEATEQATVVRSGDHGDDRLFTWSTLGRKVITVTVENCGGTMQVSHEVTVTDVAIVGLAARNSGPTTLGRSTHFTATVDAGTNVVYAWDFGDGDTGAGTQVNHTYLHAGGFTAVVTALNASGGVMTTTLVQVTNLAPVADAGPDQEVDPEVIVTLDGRGSTDPDGHLPLDYCWSQTGGLPLVSLTNPSTLAPTFTAPEEDTVLTFTLRVTDTYGLGDAIPDVVQIRVTDTNYEIYLPLVLRN